MATIKDIANRLGVSISTVSKGLNNASDISEEMRKLVFDTAIDMGYNIKKKNKIAGQKVCIIVENMEYANIDQFGYELISGFKLAAAESGYEVDIIPINQYLQNEQSYDALLSRGGYSGTFILGLELNEEYTKQLEHTTYPTVLFDNHIANKNTACIGTDIVLGFNTLVKALKDNGHTKIAFLNGSSNSYISSEREQSYRHAMSKYGLNTDETLIEHTVYYPDESVSKPVKQFVENGATAIMCASDLIAARVINELHKMNLRVPEDISITGFDDLPLAKYLAPPLATVRQERFELGKSAFDLLQSLLSGHPVCTMLLHSSVIIRESLGKAPTPHQA